MFCPRMRLLGNFLISSRQFSTTTYLDPRRSANAKPWLFVGLGNPGEKYQLTRHNVGFDMIDAFAESAGISMSSVHCKALFGQGLVSDAPILLAKPQTYMNLSGESVGPLAAYYKFPLDRVLVIYDDMDLQCGILRIQPRVAHAGHKGLMNVIRHFRRNREFACLRIGIGQPPGQMDPTTFVLQKFNATGREHIDAALKDGVEMLKTLVLNGLDACASSENSEQKYKYLKGHGVSA